MTSSKYLLLEILVLFLALIACISRSNNFVFPSKEVNSIIVRLNHSKNAVIYNIRDKKKINQIVNSFRSCKQEPLVFYATYSLDIVYSDSTRIEISYGDKVIRVNGLTYRIKNDITNYLVPD